MSIGPIPHYSALESYQQSAMLVCVYLYNRNRDRNRKLEISAASTKAKSHEPAYSQALVQNKINRQRIKSRESATAMVDGV